MLQKRRAKRNLNYEYSREKGLGQVWWWIALDREWEEVSRWGKLLAVCVRADYAYI